MKSGRAVTLGDIFKDPRERARNLLSIPLVLQRKGEITLLPGWDICLQEDDLILCCGRYSAYSRMEWTLQNEHALTYVRTGGSAPQGIIWRMLRRGKQPVTD